MSSSRLKEALGLVDIQVLDHRRRRRYNQHGRERALVVLNMTHGMARSVRRRVRGVTATRLRIFGRPAPFGLIDRTERALFSLYTRLQPQNSPSRHSLRIFFRRAKLPATRRCRRATERPA